MEEEDVRGDRGLSVFRLCAVSRLTLVVRCTEIGYSVSTQVFGFRFVSGWFCVVGFAWLLFVLFSLLFDSAWWNRGIAEEVTMASNGKAVTGTAVMARSANEKKKSVPFLATSTLNHKLLWIPNPLLSHTNPPHSNSMTNSSKLSWQLMTKIGGVFKLAVTPSVDAKNWSYASHPQCLVAGSVLRHRSPRDVTSSLPSSFTPST